jgi:trk system potassium uptake protein TrkA
MARYGVIGLGNFGVHVARVLFEEGHEVLVVDADRAQVQKVKDLASVALVGDAASKEFLVTHGFTDLDAVVISTGDRSHVATLITLYLKELKVKRILVKAISEDHGRILEKVGASDVIFPEKDMAIRTARRLLSPNVLEYLPLGDDFSLTETAPPQDFIGKNLMQLDLRSRFQVNVLGIKDVLTDTFIPFPPSDRVIRDSDILIMAGHPEQLEKACRKKG